MKLRGILNGAVFAAAIAGFTLVGSGCGSGPDAPKTDDKPGATNAASATPITITGAGSTFVNPAMSKWAFAYHEKNPNITINYQSVGSGKGISQYQQGTVDFGATDAPLSDKDAATMPAPTLNLPIVSGAVAIAYNAPGVTDLKLSPEVLADIFLGKIKTWNDPKIAADNAGAKLPATNITVCHRSDGSGTTFIFTDYLSTISADWKAGPGTNKSPNWPVGVGGKGSEGVAGLVKSTPGGIGYVELAYAIQTKMDFASLKNAAGKFIKPSPEATTAAADGFLGDMKNDIRKSIVNSPAPDAYPIAGFTYILVSTKPANADKSKAMIDFLKWCMADGQAMAKELQYAPLSPAIVELNSKALEGVGAK